MSGYLDYENAPIKVPKPSRLIKFGYKLGAAIGYLPGVATSITTACTGIGGIAAGIGTLVGLSFPPFWLLPLIGAAVFGVAFLAAETAKMSGYGGVSRVLKKGIAKTLHYGAKLGQTIGGGLGQLALNKSPIALCTTAGVLIGLGFGGLAIAPALIGGVLGLGLSILAEKFRHDIQETDHFNNERKKKGIWHDVIPSDDDQRHKNLMPQSAPTAEPITTLPPVDSGSAPRLQVSSLPALQFPLLPSFVPRARVNQLNHGT